MNLPQRLTSYGKSATTDWPTLAPKLDTARSNLRSRDLLKVSIVFQRAWRANPAFVERAADPRVGLWLSEINCEYKVLWSGRVV